MMKHYVVVFIMAFGLTNSSIHSAVTMEMKITSFEKSNPRKEHVALYFQKGHIKASDGQGFSMIYSLEDNNVISIDHDNRIYRVIDTDTMRLLKRRQEVMKTRMQETISKASIEKRSVMQDSMRKQMAEWNVPERNVPEEMPILKSVTSVRRTTRIEEAGAYHCTVYDYYYKDEKTKEYCMVSWDDLDVNKNFRDTVYGISGFSNNILSKLKYMPSAQAGLNYFSHADELEGFPVIVREFHGNNIIKESIVENVSKQVFESELFAPLQAYKKMEINI